MAKCKALTGSAVKGLKFTIVSWLSLRLTTMHFHFNLRRGCIFWAKLRRYVEFYVFSFSVLRWHDDAPDLPWQDTGDRQSCRRYLNRTTRWQISR